MDNKLSKIEKFMAKANKKMKKEYGANVLYSGDGVGNFSPYRTGFPTIDNVNSGIGGFPRGGVTLIHGLESTGKTTLVLEAIKYNMSINPDSTAFYLDVENALTEDFLEFKGIDSSRITLSSLNTEDGLTLAKDAIAENVYDILVIDSLAKLDSKNMIEGDMGDKKQRNQRARIITEFLRFITYTLRNSNTALILINQEIENQDRKNKFEPKTVLPCGKQQVFSANLRLQITRQKRINKTVDKLKIPVGYVARIVSLKNKISKNERAVTTISCLYDRGFIREISHIDYLMMTGVIEKTGKLYKFKNSEYYPDPFKTGEVMEILSSIQDMMGVNVLELAQETADIEFETDKDIEVVDDDEED